MARKESLDKALDWTFIKLVIKPEIGGLSRANGPLNIVGDDILAMAMTAPENGRSWFAGRRYRDLDSVLKAILVLLRFGSKAEMKLIRDIQGPWLLPKKIIFVYYLYIYFILC